MPIKKEEKGVTGGGKEVSKYVERERERVLLLETFYTNLKNDAPRL